MPNADDGLAVRDSGRRDDDDSGPAGRIDVLYPGSASHLLSITFDAGILASLIDRSRRCGMAGYVGMMAEGRTCPHPLCSLVLSSSCTMDNDHSVALTSNPLSKGSFSCPCHWNLLDV